jgi:hypothetical protein
MHKTKEHYGESTLLNFISGNTGLNVAVTAEFIDALITTFKRFDEMARATKLKTTPTKAVKAVSQPFAIRNETGQTVHFWLSTKDDKETLLRGEEKAIQRDKLHKIFGSHKAELLGIDTKTETSSNITIQVESTSLHKHQPVRVPISFTVPKIAELDTNIKLVCEMRYKAGTRVLTLRSNIVLWNDTNYPIEVRLIRHGISDHIALLGKDFGLYLSDV